MALRIQYSLRRMFRMTLQTAIFETIKSNLPDFTPYITSINDDGEDLDNRVLFGDFDFNKENVGIAFRGGIKPLRSMSDGHIFKRSIVAVMNYNTADISDGYDYGNKVLDTLSSLLFVDVIDTDTNTKLGLINNITIESDVNYLGKNANNNTNMFSLSFNINYS